MKYDKEKTPYEGYFINIVIYSVAMIVGSFGALICRTLVSFFVRTPSVVELKADASYLVDKVYPIEAFFTIAGFLAGGFFCCFYIAGRIAKRNGINVDTFKIKMQMLPSAAIVSFVNMFIGFMESFSGIFGMQFWYPAAVFTRLFGGFSNTDILADLTVKDLEHSGFIPDAIAFRFLPLTLVFAIIECVAFGVVCYYGRKAGMKRGLKAREDYISDVHGN